MFYAYWYGGGAPWPTAKKLVELLRTLKRHGVTGFIPQHALEEALKYIKRHDVTRICADEGVVLMLGLGLDRGPSTPSDAVHETNVTRGIIAGLDAVRAHTVERLSLDWEGYWDGKRAMAQRIARAVLDAHPEAPIVTEDCPWWAPKYRINRQGKRTATHPNAPTVEFGSLVTSRWVQAYGAQADGSPDGRTLAWLSWARSPSQYASLGPWRIGLTSQLYARSLNDQVRTLLAEPEQRLWTWNQAETRARTALLTVEALRSRGFTGTDAVSNFQRASSLTIDGIVGPQTLGALGLK